jgi:dihydroorotate dehydrogenase (NAD+) catalytic subunit
MAELGINIAGLKFKNPVLTASGTFGYGEEFTDFIDLNRLGGFIVKGTTLHPRQGNAYPRLAETPSGMINAVGLQNKGVQYFIDNIWPRIKGYDTNVIVNLSGSSVDDYREGARMLNEVDGLNCIELNISCPNVKAGGMTFGTQPEMAAQVVSAVRQTFTKMLIVKLTPNVTSVADIAKAVEGAGADAVSLINTVLAMAVDAERQRPVLSTITGGLSGAAVKPIALRCVWQVYHAVQIPIVGLGGIMNATDAIEFMLCGARAIEVGTANFIDPAVTVKIVEGISEYLDRHGCKDVNEIIGGLKV